MIHFKYKHHPSTLAAGDLWTENSQVDTYRDTPSEQLIAINQKIATGTPWREIVASYYQKTNPWLYSIITSPTRDLFFRKFIANENSQIIDIGSGWGQIALPLARKNYVTALEPTPERLAFIRAAARQEGLDNRMYFMETDLFSVDFEAHYDLACCIGVLEWIPKFREGPAQQTQIDFLDRCRRLLKPGGKLIVGIENRLGLKYILGANDDHTGKPNISVFDTKTAEKKYRDACGGTLRSFTFSQSELRDLLKESGFNHCDFFCSFPDYKLPQVITSWGSETDQICSHGAPCVEHDGSNGKPLTCIEELDSHYASLSKQGIASVFAPSFFVVAS